MDLLLLGRLTMLKLFSISNTCAAEDERVRGNHPDPGSWNANVTSTTLMYVHVGLLLALCEVRFQQLHKTIATQTTQ